MTSRIDELQRLHEAAADGFLDTRLGMVCSEEVRDSIVALHNSWPAIHRVLVAARKVAGDGGHLFIHELEQELRALDGWA